MAKIMATFTVTLTKREATFTLFMVPWKMANSRYFFFSMFQPRGAFALSRNRIRTIPCVVIFSGGCAGVQDRGISLLYAEPREIRLRYRPASFPDDHLLHARLLSMWRRHLLLLHRLLYSYHDCRRGNHCHGDVNGTAGSR